LQFTLAVVISQAEDSEVPNVLRQAYEEKLLRGQRLIAAKKLIEQRRRPRQGLGSLNNLSVASLTSAAAPSDDPGIANSAVKQATGSSASFE
jgi:hypothetical protein